jgi:peptidoglycan hydrolase-like protein with peptidoglycan-binding domain
MNYVVVSETSLRPDPDETSPEVIKLVAGDKVSSSKELGTWRKVSHSAKDGNSYFGWVLSNTLSQDQAKQFQIFDEPDGVARTVIGEISGVRLELPPWRKVDVTLSDGSAISGWIVADAAGGTTEPATGQKKQAEDQGPALELGINEVYREYLVLAQTRTGIDAAAIAALIGAEAAKLANGQWNKDSKAETSSAAGLTQFLSATWLGEARKARTLLNERAKEKGYVTATNAIAAGREEDLLALRFDPELSIVAAAEYGLANLNALIKAGLVEADIGDDDKARFIYLAHHEGLGGAQAFLRGSIGYSFGDLARQVGQSRAQILADAAGGDTTRAYRDWLNGYLDRNIQPSKFRKELSVDGAAAGQGTKALSQYDGPPIMLTNLGADIALAKAIQWRLTELGYLDPPADGKFGPVSTWALTEFCERNGLSLSSGFTRAVARSLISPAKPLPDIAPTGTWFDKVVAYMNAKRYFICRHPDCKNIVYLEGVNRDGTLNDDEPNKFNDLRIVFSVGEDGRVDLENSCWDGTTEPGKFWTVKPMNPKGAARIAFNQYKAWVVGIHQPSPASAHEALVQVEPVTVYRDLNKDFKRTGDVPDHGLFGINQHWGYDAPKDDLGGTSAGCLVGRTREGHRKFMSLVKSDPRYAANHSYRFVTAVLPGDEVL